MCVAWFDRAFGKDRNKMVYRFAWIHEKKPEQKEKERKLGIQYFVRINYKIFNEVRKYLSIFFIG
jgi:hypothetical protein